MEAMYNYLVLMHADQIEIRLPSQQKVVFSFQQVQEAAPGHLSSFEP